MLGWRKDKKDPTPERSHPDEEAPPRGSAPAASAAGRASDAGGPGPTKRLGEMLFEEGFITQGQLKEALARKDRDQSFVGKALVELGYIDQKTLMTFLVKQCKIPHISLLDYEINNSLLEFVPQELCLKHLVLPIDRLGKILTVAMVDPLDSAALEELRNRCPDLRIKPILCDWDHFKVVVGRLFANIDSSEHEVTAESLGLATLRPGAKPTKPPEPAKPKPGDDQAVDAAVESLLKESTPAPLKTKEEAPSAKASAPPDRKSPPAPAAKDAKEKEPAASTPAPAARPAPSGPAPAPTRPQSVEQAAARLAPAPAVPVEELAARMQEGVERALQDAMAGLAAQVREAMPTPSAATAGPSAQELAALMHDNMQGALRETLAPLIESLSKASSEPQKAAGPSAQELAAIVGGSVREALEDGLGGLAEEFHKAIRESQPASASPSPEQLAGLLNEGVRGAMQEAMASLAGELRASLHAQDAPAAATPDALAGCIRDSVQDAMQGVVAALREHTQRVTVPPAGEGAGPVTVDVPGLVQATVQNAMEGVTAALAEQARQMTALRTEGPTAEELTSVLSGSVQEAVKDLTSVLTTHAQQEAQSRPVPPTADELAAAVRASMQDALGEMTAAVSEQSHRLAVLLENEDGPTPEQLATLLGTSVREAMQESVKTLAADLTAAKPDDELLREILAQQGAQAERTAAEFREALDTVRQAMKTAREAQTPQASQVSQDVREALDAVRQVIQATQEAQAAREARLAAILEQVVQPPAKPQVPEPDGTIVPLPVERRRTSEPEGKRGSAARSRKNEAEAIETVRGSGALGPSDERVRAAMDGESPLDAFTFEGYFVGKANAFAFALAKAVAENPGTEYNPFFLYGEVGTGKTHLISAIANEIREQDRDVRIGYVSAGRFARRLLEAARDTAIDGFREGYCHCDVFVFDDVQFLAGHDDVQEEFFHIFNALQMERRQIILAADKAPDKLGQLEKRLVSRFSGGIVASLAAPDWETRLKILRRQAEENGLGVPEDILALIATRVPSDVRKMTGCLKKVIAFAKLVDREITCDLAVEILTHLGVGEAA